MVASESLGPEFEEIRTYLPEGFDGVIVDAGAYIGSVALKLSNMYPNAKIVCVEAAAQNFTMLQQNVAQNPGIDTIKAALAVRSGITLELKDPGRGHWGFTTVTSPEHGTDLVSVEKVDTISLADIRRKYPDRPIGLVKLDIEGGEKALFEEESIELSQVPLVFVELHDHIVRGCTAAFNHYSRNREIVNFGGEKFLSHSRLDGMSLDAK